MTRKRVIVGSLALVVCSLALVGCGDEKEKARAEATAARIELSKVRADLVKAKSQIADLKEELDAAIKTRDELDQQAHQLVGERDNAIAEMQKAKETARAVRGQSTEAQEALAATLRSEIDGLKAVVVEQESTIAEQQATIEQLLSTIEAMDKDVEEAGPGAAEEQEEPTEPNEVIEEL